MKKLAIVTTHPIQYYAPIFKLLQQRKNISIKVFYTLGNNDAPKHDRGFGKPVSWDIPLLDGYDFEWLDNTSKVPGSHHFKGIVNPGGIVRIEKYQPDALLIFGWAYQSHLKIIRYFNNKVPIYFRGDSTLLNEPAGLKKTLRHIFLTWVYKNISHAFYVGKNNKAYYQKYRVKENRLTFAPHAIDNERFAAARNEEAAQLRSSLNINAGDIVILYAGKFEPVKNIELLLSAFKILNKPNVHLLLAGNGPNETGLKAMADESGSEGNIYFTGFKNQTYMPVLYQAADLFCLPSKSETWGLAANEAMACGKAVLVSDKVGCAPDLVGEKNGAVFISGDIKDLENHLRQLTEDKAGLNKMGQQSAEIIKDWSFLHIAKAIEDKLLSSVC